METPKIKLSDLHKRFDEKVVLNGLDLEIEAGESLVVIGGSGTGKSVMLKCILGLLTPEQGDIRIDGQSVIGISSSEREKVNAKIGMLFQNAALFDSLLVWENVAFGFLHDRKSGVEGKGWSCGGESGGGRCIKKNTKKKI